MGRELVREMGLVWVLEKVRVMGQELGLVWVLEKVQGMGQELGQD